jgi:ribosome-associated heat shock protein Hsp15
MTNAKEIRVDKFLWAARIYKTRSLASDECRKGRILINNVQVKPSRNISANEIITVKKPPASFIYRVIQPAEKRVSAKLVNQIIEDITPEEEKLKLETSRSVPSVYRRKGTGRPTKKERRLIDRLHDDLDGSINT